MPGTAYLAANWREMERLSFDGLAVKALSGSRDLGLHVFGRDRITALDTQQAIRDLRSVKARRLLHRFVKINACPDTNAPRWFDDEWITIVRNAATMARVAYLGGCVGLVFDPEPYGMVKLWRYNSVAGYTFEETVAQVHKRGSEFMRSLNGQFPRLVLFSLFGPSINAFQPGPLVGKQYALLPAFFDGMCEAADDGTRIVDGFEGAYGWRTKTQFALARKRYEAANGSRAYVDHMELGIAVWLNYKGQVDYYTPEQFGEVLTLVREVSDRYVWIYTQHPFDWWAGTVPKEYAMALQ